MGVIHGGGWVEREYANQGDQNHLRWHLDTMEKQPEWHLDQERS